MKRNLPYQTFPLVRKICQISSFSSMLCQERKTGLNATFRLASPCLCCPVFSQPVLFRAVQPYLFPSPYLSHPQTYRSLICVPFAFPVSRAFLCFIKSAITAILYVHTYVSVCSLTCPSPYPQPSHFNFPHPNIPAPSPTHLPNFQSLNGITDIINSFKSATLFS